MHSVLCSDSHRTSQQIETALIRTRTSQRWSVSAGLTAHLELLAASWPLDVSILCWPSAVTYLAWTSHYWNTLLSLSFSVWEKEGKRLPTAAQVHFTKTVCAPHLFFLSETRAFILLISRKPTHPKGLCASQKKIRTEQEQCTSGRQSKQKATATGMQSRLHTLIASAINAPQFE